MESMKWKGKTRKVFVLFALICSLFLMTGSAQAATKRGWVKVDNYYRYYNNFGRIAIGWHTIDGKDYYFRTTVQGKAPIGSRVTGFYKVGSYTYYFDKYGRLQTGWQTINNKNYYFQKSGALGSRGKMFVGFRKADTNYRFLFQTDGSVAIGWKEYNGNTYFFSNGKILGIRGRAMTGWKGIYGYRYYFTQNGILQKNCWIDNRYYVDEKGRMLTSTVTPDGYVVNENGEKQKKASGWKTIDGKTYYYVNGQKATGFQTISGTRYYFNSQGVQQKQTGWLNHSGNRKYFLRSGIVQTGWQTISGKVYYFSVVDGRMARSTTVNGVKIGADGVADKLPTNVTKAKVLILSGHGQGDVGAVGVYGSKTYYEYQCTREFASLIKQKLAAYPAINVTLYNQNYDLYQVMSGMKSGPIPKLTDYDYILEIHFNATAESGKDKKGDGKYKGVGMYVNSAKKNTTIDKKIVKAISNTGFPIWGRGNGIFTSSGLFNAKTCQKKGVSYGLLETAFIDDKDDISFYNKNKDKMAAAAASAIVSYFN